MREFFARELNVDIDDPRYARNGISKGKRLPTFLTIAELETAARTLKAPWEYRQAGRIPADTRHSHRSIVIPTNSPTPNGH